MHMLCWYVQTGAQKCARLECTPVSLQTLIMSAVLLAAVFPGTGLSVA
jgi:hypothetical protein